jgi:pyrroline-5-carboxylate reductase
MQIGFIGAGNMAGAIIQGLVTSGFVAGDQIGATSLDAAGLDALARRTGIVPVAGNTELVAQSQVVVLAVKPQQLDQVMEGVGAQLVAQRPLVVSIAAGITLERLAGWLSPNVALVRAMPNLNVRVGQGMTAVAGNEVATQSQVEQVRDLFGAVGQAMVLEERLFPAFSAIAGAAPAWVFLAIDALARGALAAGMTKAQAREAATQTVLGSAALLQATGEHPWVLIDQVASPGGTTVAGLNVLEDRGFSAALVAAVAATITRDVELGQSA